MVEESVFRGTLEFFNALGVFDVVLPFLLVFTLVFAMLEKTKILGTTKVKDQELTRRSLNSMIAFVTAFFVIASSQLVGIINDVLGKMVLLLLLSICFMLLVGSFHKGDKEFELNKTFKWIFMIIMFIGIILIFLNAIKTPDGESWLEYAYNFLIDNYDSRATASIILVIIVIGFILFITWEPKKYKNNEDKG
ncbi:MAG: hypothetical protein QXG00_02020 [Candidatus Woesearchaeota archaeon]